MNYSIPGGNTSNRLFMQATGKFSYNIDNELVQLNTSIEKLPQRLSSISQLQKENEKLRNALSGVVDKNYYENSL